MHDLSHHTRVSRCKSGIGWLMDSLWTNAKGRTILSTTIYHHLDLFIYVDCHSPIATALWCTFTSLRVWMWLAPLSHHTLYSCMTRWALVGHGGWFRTVLSGRLTLTGCPFLQMLWLVHPSFAFLAHGQLRPQSRQNRNPSVIQSSRQKQLWWMRPGAPQASAVTKTRDFALDLLLGFWHRPKKNIFRTCEFIIAAVFKSHRDDSSIRGYHVLNHCSSEPCFWIKRDGFWCSSASL